MPPKKTQRDSNQATLDKWLQLPQQRRRKEDPLVPVPTRPATTPAAPAPPAAPPAAAPPPPSTAAGGRNSSRTVCKFHMKPGGCRDGAKCRYAHPDKRAAAPKAAPIPAATSGGRTLRMPWSDFYTYTGPTGSSLRHWDRTTALLQECSVATTTDLEELLVTLLPQRNRGEYPNEMSSLVDVLDLEMTENERNHFLGKVLPWMQALVVSAPALFPTDVPLLPAGSSGKVVLTQRQVCALLACCFFNLMPFRHKASRIQFTSAEAADYADGFPHINFGSLYEMGGAHNKAKIRCFLEYFVVMHDTDAETATKAGGSAAPVNIEIARIAASDADTIVSRLESATNVPLSGVELSDDGVIENRVGAMQADFANKMLGGGVLGRGCVQEEVRFAVSPELMLSRIVCARLLPNEAVVMNGAAQFSRYDGYASTFRFAGRCPIPPLTDFERKVGMRNVCVIAVDAVDFSSGNMNPNMQFNPHWVDRELIKATIAFTGTRSATLPSSHEGVVATGNWGCGAFAGDHQLKMAIQWAACSITRRPMVYFTFGNAGLTAAFQTLQRQLAASKTASVGNLVKAIRTYHNHRYAAMPASVPGLVEVGDADDTPTMDDIVEVDVEPDKALERTPTGIRSVFDHLATVMGK